MSPRDRRDFGVQERMEQRRALPDEGPPDPTFGQNEYFAEQGRAQFGPGVDHGLSRSRGRRRGAQRAQPPPPDTPSPYERPSAWDTVTIAGNLFLGLASIKGKTGNDVEKKKHKGRDGHRVTDKGAEASEFQIVFRYWDRATWASWCQVLAAIDPQRPVEQRTPVDVTHPALVQRRINRVYVKAISFPEQGREGWTVTVDVIQWLPPAEGRNGRSVTRSPTANAGGIGSNGTAFSGLEGDNPFGGYGENQPLVDAWARSQGLGPPDPASTDTGPSGPADFSDANVFATGSD